MNDTPGNSIIINLSMLLTKPTGIANYANNLLRYFSLDYTSLLAPKYYRREIHKNPYFIADKFSPEYGLKGHFYRLLWTQTELPSIFRRIKGNLLFSPCGEMPLFANIKTIVVVHDLIPLRFPKIYSSLTHYCRYILPLVCQQATHIICNSKATADDLINILGVKANKITPILLGIDRNKFRPIENAKNIGNTRFFLYVGRHELHKNLSRIIAAFAQFKYQKEYQLWIAGETDSRYTPPLKKQVRELGIDDRVKFLDYVAEEELPILLNQAEALLFPSLWEGFGFPVLEAMACGTPVITSKVSSLPEVAGDAALLVNPTDVREIASAMNLLVEDEGVKRQLRELGLKRVMAFSWEKTAQQTVEVLKHYL